MRASVIIPYGYRSPWEDKLFRYVTEEFWLKLFPEWELLIGKSPQPFNRSAARNGGARRATCDVLVFCDADTVPLGACGVALAASQAGERWFGSDAYIQADMAYTQALVEGAERMMPGTVIPNEHTYSRQPGGVLVCHRDSFVGFDEGFQGWGYEDTAFVAAMTALNGERDYFGDVVHLWHPKVRAERQQQPLIRRNNQRYGWYRRAAQEGPRAMRELLQRLDVHGNDPQATDPGIPAP
jgi:hypothetical protein